jgi:hypothetical protein
MATTQFDRDSMARWYAKQHLKTDPGLVSVYYLPQNAPEREIRFLEVNKLMGARSDNSLQPIDFGIDMGTESEHTLFVLDVTPEQLTKIQEHSLKLPGNWSLDSATRFQ